MSIPAEDSEKQVGVGEGEDDDKSMEDNLDEQEMPEDLDYKRKVQLLLEHRQRNAEHLWGARAAPSIEPASSSALNNNEQFVGSKNSQNMKQTKPAEQTTNQMDEDSPQSSELSDEDDQEVPKQEAENRSTPANNVQESIGHH